MTQQMQNKVEDSGLWGARRVQLQKGAGAGYSACGHVVACAAVSGGDQRSDSKWHVLGGKRL